MDPHPRHRDRSGRARRLGRLLGWTTLVGLALAAGTLQACADAVTSRTTGSEEAGTGQGAEAGDGGGRPIVEEPIDATTDAGDGGGPTIIDGPGEAGAECAFNRECKAALRCECSVSAGCACAVGVRGTGQNGVTPCSDGNACASSVCVEGPPDSGSFCSDECKTSADCTGKLPLCSNVAFVGRICIRTSPN